MRTFSQGGDRETGEDWVESLVAWPASRIENVRQEHRKSGWTEKDEGCYNQNSGCRHFDFSFSKRHT